MSLALKLALGPLLLAQAVHTRRRLPKLPEAAGPREGVAGSGAAGPSLLIVGDSSAAGVGVDQQEQALAGQLSSALAERLGLAVRWQLCAQSGLSSAQMLALLPDARPADVAVLVSGVNDVIDQISPRQALRDRQALLDALRQRTGVRHVVMTPVPPMGHFSGLPQPLRWLAGRDATAHEAALARWAVGRPGVSHLSFNLPMDDPALLASDGFHPGALLYRFWGQTLARHIAGSVLAQL